MKVKLESLSPPKTQGHVSRRLNQPNRFLCGILLSAPTVRQICLWSLGERHSLTVSSVPLRGEAVMVLREPGSFLWLNMTPLALRHRQLHTHMLSILFVVEDYNLIKETSDYRIVRPCPLLFLSDWEKETQCYFSIIYTLL